MGTGDGIRTLAKVDFQSRRRLFAFVFVSVHFDRDGADQIDGNTVTLGDVSGRADEVATLTTMRVRCSNGRFVFDSLLSSIAPARSGKNVQYELYPSTCAISIRLYRPNFQYERKERIEPFSP